MLLNTTSEKLYHNFAKELPIIDYHNHLPPMEIATNKQFANITEVWLKGDHYKWRAMRANGIDERYITGDAPDKEKFLKWAETVPYTMRNPLYHWSHLELQRYFGIDTLLSPTTAEYIYDEASEKLQGKDYSTLALLHKMKVEVVCTTDHPTDNLDFHKQHASSDSTLRMLPTFRPDKFIVINNEEFLDYVEKLEELVNSQINTFEDLMLALEKRIDYFQQYGCQLADHGLSQLYAINFKEFDLDDILQKRKTSKLSSVETQAFLMASLNYLAKLYHQHNWTMQLHLGPLRNNNKRLLKSVGDDVGCDSIGDFEQAEGLSFFLSQLDSEKKLPKTILYNLNPRDNEVFATMAGNFNDSSIAGKIQWGSAWWFLDQKDGMEQQINALSNHGLLSRFVGMLTDSRSFLSFPRHEYFRRILCNLIGRDVHNGELPNDIDRLGQMVEDICYKNAIRYFNF